MRSNRLLFWMASFLALSLVLAACGGGDGGGGGGNQEEAACKATDLEGTALGSSTDGLLEDAKPVGSVRTLAQGSKPTVKIGMFGDLTGANSALVTPIRNAAALAIKQRNAKGDLQVNVEFVPRDNKDANPETAGPIEQGFIDDPAVVGVIGGAFSGETAAVGRRFDAAGLTHISASATNPDLTKNGWPFYRAVVTDDVQGQKVAEVLAAIGCERVAVIDDRGDYGKGLADFVEQGLRSAGVEVVVREGVAAETTDYGPLIDTLAANNPDAVFYGGYYNGGSLLLKQMRERGLDATFSCGDGCADKQLITLAGEQNANGSIITCPCTIPVFATEGPAQQLQQQYRAEYNIDALIYSAEAYDAANIFLEAIAASDDDGKVTREEILNFVNELSGFEGVSRTYTFDDKGELAESSRTINVYPIEGGELKLAGTTDEVTG